MIAHRLSHHDGDHFTICLSTPLLIPKRLSEVRAERGATQAQGQQECLTDSKWLSVRLWGEQDRMEVLCLPVSLSRGGIQMVVASRNAHETVM